MKLLNKPWFPWAVFCSLLIFMVLLQTVRVARADAKVKTIQVFETVIMSRECPPDANGSKNNWYLSSTDGETVVMLCSYNVEDNSPEEKK
jgi:hypothetical protein